MTSSIKKSSYGIVVHAGAGPDSEFIRENKADMERGLTDAINAAVRVLKKNGCAIDAVEAAVMSMEDNPLFNAGKGSALNVNGKVEMDASLMDGKTRKAGAVAMVSDIRNPIALARMVMEKTNHVLIAAEGATHLAAELKIPLESQSYFITSHQYEEYLKESKKLSVKDLFSRKVHGTVGAVAFDSKKNIAAATSTGGTAGNLSGRIGDSCMIGAGCYADSKTCAVSGTGDGEYLILNVIAHSVASALEHTRIPLQEVCDYIVHEKNKEAKGDIGVISVDPNGHIGISFNSERMLRGWCTDEIPLEVKIYK